MDEERVIEEAEQPKKKRARLVAKKHTGFQCSFCGNYTTDINEYYSSLSKVMLTRFINLLKSNNAQSYSEGVMDCIQAVFGEHNPVMRKTLRLEGYLEKFDQRYDIEAQNSSNQNHGRIRCYKCGNWYEDYLITIDIISPYRTELICDDCLSSSKTKKDKNG